MSHKTLRPPSRDLCWLGEGTGVLRRHVKPAARGLAIRLEGVNGLTLCHRFCGECQDCAEASLGAP
jgi:bacterioferritin-associated ferredoxin